MFVLCNDLLFLELTFGGVATAAAVLGATGLIIGILLGIAAKKLAVKTDDRVAAVREKLLGSNCGGCGYAGCDACAEAIVKSEAPVTICRGSDVEAIAKIMGVSAEAEEKTVAFVRCSGTCDRTDRRYNYTGLADCRNVVLLPGGGEKSCSYGCLGYGSCEKVCQYDAIHVVMGVAQVDRSRCIGCSACSRVCPKDLIEMIPAKSGFAVACFSKEKGRDVRAVCEEGCIGCGICVKQCESGAITLEDNLAHIDQEKCVGCGKCAEKCPRKIIKVF